MSVQMLSLGKYIPLALYFNVTFPTLCTCNLKVKAVCSSNDVSQFVPENVGVSFQKAVIFNKIFSLHLGYQKKYPQAQIISIGGLLCGTEKHDVSLMVGNVSSARM